MTRKSTAPDRLRLWVDTLRKAPPAFGNVPRKNVHTRRPSASGPRLAESLESLRKRAPKKTFTPAGLRPPGYASRKSRKPSGNVSRKTVHARRPSAYGLRLVESPSSLRKRAPKKRSRHTAFGLRATPREKPLQPSATYPEKTFTPASLWLPGYAPRKVSPALRNVPRKNVHTCRPSALSPYLAKSPESARKRALKKRLRPPAFGRRATPRKKSGKRSETYPEKTFTPVGLRPPGYTLRKAPKAVGNVA